MASEVTIQRRTDRGCTCVLVIQDHPRRAESWSLGWRAQAATPGMWRLTHQRLTLRAPVSMTLSCSFCLTPGRVPPRSVLRLAATGTARRSSSWLCRTTHQLKEALRLIKDIVRCLAGVLTFCAKQRSTRLDQLNQLQYILDNPSRFDPSTGVGHDVIQAASSAPDGLDLIASCASNAIRNPKDAEMPSDFAVQEGTTYPKTVVPSPLSTPIAATTLVPVLDVLGAARRFHRGPELRGRHHGPAREPGHCTSATITHTRRLWPTWATSTHSERPSRDSCAFRTMPNVGEGGWGG